MGHQSAPIAYEHAQQVKLDRGQVHVLSAPTHDTCGQVDLQVSDRNARLLLRAAATTQRGLQARHQLARSEWLCYVVVGSRLERPNLLLLLADCREHENWHLTPLAQQTRELDSVHVGQHQIDDRRLRRAHGRSIQSLACRFGWHYLKARVAQHHTQGAQDLRLVVHDEDSLCRRRLVLCDQRACSGLAATATAASGSRAGCCDASGSSSTNVAPCPGSDSTCSLPPLDSVKPRAIASPKPDPRCPPCGVPARSKGSNTRSSCAGGVPGLRSTTRTTSLSPAGAPLGPSSGARPVSNAAPERSSSATKYVCVSSAAAPRLRTARALTDTG